MKGLEPRGSGYPWVPFIYRVQRPQKVGIREDLRGPEFVQIPVNLRQIMWEIHSIEFNLKLKITNSIEIK